jgi:hypothetical protein
VIGLFEEKKNPEPLPTRYVTPTRKSTLERKQLPTRYVTPTRKSTLERKHIFN